jgi:hypothetical protein
MTKNQERWRDAKEWSRCQMGHFPSKSPTSSSCAEPVKEEVDGLLLCERHALEAKLEGQIECWGQMLLHIGLWTAQASRQNKTRIVELLGVERAKARAAMQRASEDLDTLRRGETLGEEVDSVDGSFV